MADDCMLVELKHLCKVLNHPMNDGTLSKVKSKKKWNGMNEPKAAHVWVFLTKNTSVELNVNYYGIFIIINASMRIE